MQIHDETAQSITAGAEPELQRSSWSVRWKAITLATLAMFAIWAAAPHLPPGDTDELHYLSMADGKLVMKPFAFRFLAPAVVRVFTHITGLSTEHGFLVLGVLSGWVFFYGVLSLVLKRSHGLGFALVLTLIPFWLRTFMDYRLPDAPHAALCMVYLLLLRRRWWGWASIMLAVMYLTRESTLLIAIIAVPVLWRLAGRRAGMMQLAATLAGMAGSKLAALHALPNHQNMNDTLYMIGKIPWNLSRNVFGVILWSNTLPLFPPVRVWNLPGWIHAGGLHQIGYSAYDPRFQAFTLATILSSFGIGFCIIVCLKWGTSLRTLLPRDKPYLCIAAIYGAAAYFLAPMLGAGETRLLDYGWPLFLVYLPAVMLTAWRNAPPWAIYTLVGLNLIDAWTVTVQAAFHLPFAYDLPVYLFCNLTAGWLLLKTKSKIPGGKGANLPLPMTA
jgi:hypothetical protein